jgi:hypothetical protein
VDLDQDLAAGKGREFDIIQHEGLSLLNENGCGSLHIKN